MQAIRETHFKERKLVFIEYFMLGTMQEILHIAISCG